MANRLIKIVLAGGGTAGHVWPTLSVAEKISEVISDNKQTVDFMYFGSWHGIERELVKNAGLRFQGIVVGKARRYWSIYYLIEPLKIAIGFCQSFFQLLRWRPQVIFAKGGYVTVPVVLAARVLRIPVMLHESDSILGLANRALSRFAQIIAVSFPKEIYPKTYQAKLFYSGLMSRQLKIGPDKRHKLISELNFVDKSPIILVMGGSQGAHQINELIISNLPRLLKDFQIIHLTGKADFDHLRSQRQNLPHHLREKYAIFDFYSKILTAIAIADIVISRCGASSLAEIAGFRKPSILIPLDTSASDHQANNARAFAEHQAAVVMDPKTVSASQLYDQIDKMNSDPKMATAMGERAGELIKTDSQALIANKLLSLIE